MTLLLVIGVISALLLIGGFVLAVFFVNWLLPEDDAR